MDKIIKEIINILKPSGGKFTLTIWDDEVYVYIYETEICIVIDIKDKYVYIDCEAMNNHITSVELEELSKIVNIIEENIDTIINLIQ